jgi:hypothetical protein
LAELFKKQNHPFPYCTHGRLRQNHPLTLMNRISVTLYANFSNFP